MKRTQKDLPLEREAMLAETATRVLSRKPSNQTLLSNTQSESDSPFGILAAVT